MGAKKRTGKGKEKNGGKQAQRGAGASSGQGAGASPVLLIAALAAAAGAVYFVPALREAAGLGPAAVTQAAPKPAWDAHRIDENTARLPDPLDVIKSRFNVTVLSEDPLLLQFDDFLSDREADSLRRVGVAAGLERSTAGLGRTVDDVRTSSTAWLMQREHSHHKDVQTIERRISDVVNVPEVNMEHFQVLNYQPGQFYLTHHDYIPEHQKSPCGPRLATFFIYLSDVEEGGGTYFPQLQQTVMPKKGRAALWYNTMLNKDSGKFEQVHATEHEAQSVIKGEKWAANKWIHVEDFVGPWARGDSL